MLLAKPLLSRARPARPLLERPYLISLPFSITGTCKPVNLVKVYIQGGALNRGLKRIFSLYRPSCHIEAYIRPEKYCFVWAGPLANHHSI
jgi:hypothetical protein